MQVESLAAWPPFPSNDPSEADGAEGTFPGCDFVSATSRHPAHLLVKVRFQDRDFTAVYWHTSESVLLRLMASLRHLAGVPMAKTGEVELLDLKPIGY
jgi:hypothetical protein